MKTKCRIAALFLAGVVLCVQAKGINPRVAIKTDLGEIIIEVFERQAPVTAANFLAYVDQKLYDGASFYRIVRPDNQPGKSVKIEVIQGGLEFMPQARPRRPIPHETTDKTGVHHEDGTISMARDIPGSASSEFFICINAQPELDFMGLRNPDGQGFAAFGRVVEGMDIVRKIQGLPSEQQMLTTSVKILSVRRVN